MLLKKALKGNKSGGLHENGRPADLADTTPATLWVNMMPEYVKDAHSTVWFTYMHADAEMLGKMEWTSSGFRVIFNAKQDRFYKAPEKTKSTTVGAITEMAKQHIAAQGDKVATLQSHCHAFALAIYEGV
jgi:hypothetical protein